MISDTEYTRAIAEFVSRKGVTRCPTVCLAPTGASVSDADRLALRSHVASLDAARRARRREWRQMLAPGQESAADQTGRGREAAD